MTLQNILKILLPLVLFASLGSCLGTNRLFGSDKEPAFSEDIVIRKALDLNMPTVVITYDFSKFSGDPLDASLSRNMWIMRLLYETPIKYDKNGFMVSDILERYSFDQLKNEISFTLKSKQTFSNGQPLSIDDVAFAIKRMLFSRPEYPTIKKIAGMNEWFQKKFPLESMPSGMTIQGNTLTIKLVEHVTQPLQWFAIEIFSIIPRSCVNLQTNKLTCTLAPFSGSYELLNSEPSLLTFRRRSPNKELPQELRLVHLSPVRIIKFIEHFQNNHVIVADEINIPPDHRNIIKNHFRQNAIPEVRVMALNMNTHVPPFDQKRVRQYFAREYRRTLELLFGHSDGGIFTRIMSGYIPLSDLNANVPAFSLLEENEMLKQLREHPPVWTSHINGANHDPFHFYMMATLKRLQIPTSPPLEFRNFQDEIHSWTTGKLNIGRVFMGLGGTLDPTDDLRMFFAKNMFYQIEDLANDKKIQEFIANIKHTSLHDVDVQNLKNLNRYLFEEAIFAVVANYTIAQYTLKNSPLKIVNDWTADISHYFIK